MGLANWGLEIPDLRSVVMHVVTETAVHAGRLDAVRELIDGRGKRITGDTLRPQANGGKLELRPFWTDED